MEEIPLSSPLLLGREDTALLIIDVQEKLIPAIEDRNRLIWNIRRLADAAKIMNVRVAATEQYAKGLGGTVSPIRESLSDLSIPDKLQFSAAGCTGLLEGFSVAGIHKIVLAGIEAHVCVLQTALDLLCEGYQVYVVADAVSSRNLRDSEIALRRLESSGVYLTTTESVMFEWCRQAGTPEFKQISQLVPKNRPSSSLLATLVTLGFVEAVRRSAAATEEDIMIRDTHMPIHAVRIASCRDGMANAAPSRDPTPKGSRKLAGGQTRPRVATPGTVPGYREDDGVTEKTPSRPTEYRRPTYSHPRRRVLAHRETTSTTGARREDSRPNSTHWTPNAAAPDRPSRAGTRPPGDRSSGR